MKLTYVPLLATQHQLYQMPRGLDRFHEYLRTMLDPEANDIKLPLVAMNPMGKDHLLPFLEHLLALAADREGAEVAATVQYKLDAVAAACRVSLIVVDDQLGGWTNRAFVEFHHRSAPLFERPRVWQEAWITAYAWTSEHYDAAKVRAEVATCIYRAAYVYQHGAAQTLGELLAQEGYAMAHAGATEPRLDPDDLAYTREVLTPLLSETGQPTLMAALFGDETARELGYVPLGLSQRAGLALALHDARQLLIRVP